MPEVMEAADPAETPKEEAKEVKPTLDTINVKLDEIIKENERLKKQNADKDSHISRTEVENKTLRETLQKVTTSIEGKPEKEKDTILEKQRNRLIEKGYDANAVDSLLETIIEVADQKANERLVPIIMESAQELIESDPEIEQDFLKNNSEEITAEYNSYKMEVSPRKIKANLKKAYKIVKDKLADEARKGKEPEKKREEMVAGASAAPAGTREAPKDDFLDRIEKSGAPKNPHFI